KTPPPREKNDIFQAENPQSCRHTRHAQTTSPSARIRKADARDGHKLRRGMFARYAVGWASAHRSHQLNQSRNPIKCRQTDAV
ncbi:hypothetical protein, partial [Neisseria blantyrii]|uniref:hypothetical protein n=1 Tax=Neisseria blantyrii TaxID=2830647 RepID=UPI00272D8C77